MRRKSERRPAVFIFGAGKVGAGLARALRAHGVQTTIVAARKGLPRAIDADVLVLAVRDRHLASTAAAMRDAGVVARRAVVLHVAGALGAEVLSPLRGSCAGVGQMHPMISFATSRSTPALDRGNVLLQGDARAVARARALARLLGMTPRTIPNIDTVGYHAAAGLVANGAAALAALGTELLVRAGVDRRTSAKMLGPLLRSVADNVERLGLPEALTGPVRRGDLAGLEHHLTTLHAKLPAAVPLYVESAKAQLPLARVLGDAPAESFDEIDRFLRLRAHARRLSTGP